MRQYEMCEISFRGPQPSGSFVHVDLAAEITCGEETVSVKGFYAGEETYKIRFLPKRAGEYHVRVSGIIEAEKSVMVEPADEKHHGQVLAAGQHFAYDDGTRYSPFGTTIYAFAHQTQELIEETILSLSKSPFNKLRCCVFPKHYNYNHNDPMYYAFEKREDGSWNPDRPCMPFWDAFENLILRLQDLGIEVDLILFHPYDRWGFAAMPQSDNLTYLEYLTRRLSAFPNVWWSLANEYDLCGDKTLSDWEEIEEFTASHDPYHHLLSCHNCFTTWDYARKNVTHVSIQTKALTEAPRLYRTYNKPVIIDECCYEGNLKEFWGSISGREMTARFWRACASGAYCTHGETFLDKSTEIVWWAKGGALVGESPARIAFLREVIEGLPCALEPTTGRFSQLFFVKEKDKEAALAQVPENARVFVKSLLRMSESDALTFEASEHCWTACGGEECYLNYYDRRTCAEDELDLPESRKYRIEVIDTWNMTREVVAENVSGKYMVSLPAREDMAVLATAMD